MPVDWKHKDSFTRLLAAMVAAEDMKVQSMLAFYSLKPKYHSSVAALSFIST